MLFDDAGQIVELMRNHSRPEGHSDRALLKVAQPFESLSSGQKVGLVDEHDRDLVRIDLVHVFLEILAIEEQRVARVYDLYDNVTFLNRNKLIIKKYICI